MIKPEKFIGLFSGSLIGMPQKQLVQGLCFEKNIHIPSITIPMAGSFYRIPGSVLLRNALEPHITSKSTFEVDLEKLHVFLPVEHVPGQNRRYICYLK